MRVFIHVITCCVWIPGKQLYETHEAKVKIPFINPCYAYMHCFSLEASGEPDTSIHRLHRARSKFPHLPLADNQASYPYAKHTLKMKCNEQLIIFYVFNPLRPTIIYNSTDLTAL